VCHCISSYFVSEALRTFKGLSLISLKCTRIHSNVVLICVCISAMSQHLHSKSANACLYLTLITPLRVKSSFAKGEKTPRRTVGAHASKLYRSKRSMTTSERTLSPSFLRHVIEGRDDWNAGYEPRRRNRQMLTHRTVLAAAKKRQHE